MWGILIPFLIGIAIGYFTPGKQDKSRLYTRALIWSVIIAGIVALVGWATRTDPLSLGEVGFFSLILSFAISLLFVILGVWIGDMLEARRHRRAAVARRPDRGY